MSQRKTQFGVEGQIQPTLHITWGIYRRIPDAGNTWRKGSARRIPGRQHSAIVPAYAADRQRIRH